MDTKFDLIHTLEVAQELTCTDKVVSDKKEPQNIFANHFD